MSTDVTETPTLAAALGLGTLAWYAMPDLVRSRAARSVLKTGLLGAGLAASWPKLPLDELDELLSDQVWGTREVIGAGLGVLATAAVVVVGEKAIYAFGERRRARGARLAHTLPAIGLAVVSGALGVLPVPSPDPSN